MNYLAYDNKGIPPVIALSASFTLSSPTNGVAEEGKLVRVTASVTDDVQVRNVEFYVDGMKVVTDGNFPFEHRFNVPLRTPQKTSFIVSARASDTGGNAAGSALLTINLLPDRTPPRIVKVSPAQGSWVGSVDTVVVYVNEALDPASLDSSWFGLVAAGPDQVLGTSDDSSLTPGSVVYHESLNAIVVSLAASLSPGSHKASAGPPLRDPAGNTISETATWYFHVLGQPDADHDGVPDAVEIALGLNPFNPDTDLDGIADGEEDFDGDGLPNAFEIAAGTNPQRSDSDYNGVSDANEDPDQDGLVNSAESVARTDLGRSDTDGDGFNDGTEVTAGSNPLDARDHPLGLYVSQPVAVVNTQLPRNANNEVLGVTPAHPAVFVQP